MYWSYTFVYFFGDSPKNFSDIRQCTSGFSPFLPFDIVQSNIMRKNDFHPFFVLLAVVWHEKKARNKARKGTVIMMIHYYYNTPWLLSVKMFCAAQINIVCTYCNINMPGIYPCDDNIQICHASLTRKVTKIKRRCKNLLLG